MGEKIGCGAVMIRHSLDTLRPATAIRRPRYSVYLQVYDYLVGDPAYPDLRRAFSKRVRHFRLRLESIADIGCGTGRFLAGLANAPRVLFGVDLSPDAIEAARARLALRGVTLLRQDIRALALPRKIHLVTCHNQTINYLRTHADLLLAFRAVARNLRRGGAFLFDFIARPSAASSAPPRMTQLIRLPEVAVRFDAVVNPAQTRSTVVITLCGPATRNRKLTEVHCQRWFSPRALARLLRRSGLRLLDISPVSRVQPREWLYAVARRQ